MPREATQTTTLTVQGVEIPKLGFGTWQITGRTARWPCATRSSSATATSTPRAPTATRREVGQGLHDSGLNRDEVFLTTKLWYTELRADGVHDQLERSLRDLRTEYVDLLLIHWPSREVPLAETLGAMVEARDAGRARHLGVANFPRALLREALEHAPLDLRPGRVPPLPRPARACSRSPASAT